MIFFLFFISNLFAESRLKLPPHPMPNTRIYIENVKTFTDMKLALSVLFRDGIPVFVTDLETLQKINHLTKPRIK